MCLITFLSTRLFVHLFVPSFCVYLLCLSVCDFFRLLIRFIVCVICIILNLSLLLLLLLHYAVYALCSYSVLPATSMYK